jgi:hypothetical protein
MWKYLNETLQAPTTKWRFGWSNKQPNLALMCTLDNRTPLVFALCHPQITKEIIQVILKSMTSNSGDFLDQTQIFVAIGEVARQKKITSYDHLKPVLDVCDDNTFNQLFHFPCRYNNDSLLYWLIKESSKSKNQATRQARTFENVSLNVGDHARYTPLLTAVFYRSIKCVRYLLQVSICLKKCSYVSVIINFIF